MRAGQAAYRQWVESAIGKLWGDGQGADATGNTVEDVVDEVSLSLSLSLSLSD